MGPKESKTSLQLFSFQNVASGETLSLSAHESDGQVWFVVADVCKALGIQNSRDALTRLDEDEKGVATTDTLGGPQQVRTVNESGLYSLIFSSRKSEARRFRRWVTSEVIPSIRKHGGYINGMEALSAPDQAQTVQVIEQEALRALERHLEEREARDSAFRLMKRRPSYPRKIRKITG